MRGAAATLLIAAALLCGPAARGASRPASYAEFDTLIAPSDGAALKRLVEGGSTKFIFLRRGAYVLDNPVLVDRADSLFLHGADRMATVLVAKNPSAPLFVVQRAPLVNLAGLHFALAHDASETPNAVAILTQNAEPLTFEMLDCAVNRSMLVFRGPGTYQIQAPALGPGGRVRASIEVDHPDADLLLFAGDGSNGTERLRVDDFAFVWQKRGRVRVYATTFEGNLGPADIRIETASAHGPHVIGNVRSEGVNGALNRSGASSRLLYVPPTDQKVDVLLKGNGGAWDTGPPGGPKQRLNCTLVWYNGAGTVWLLGNRAEGLCGRHLAEGNAPEATLLSVGNLISSPEPFPIKARRIVSAADLFNHYQWTGGDGANPAVRWIPDGSPPPKLSAQASVPRVPDDALPPALMRPVLTAALPGMIDVKAAPYRAKGDGSSDDTAAIQAALDADCNKQTAKAIFFPPGSYRISATLYLNHHAGGACHGNLPYGGWIAGAGSDRTRIEMAPGLKRGVFATDGLSWATIQGITFKTWAFRAGDPAEPNFDIEFYPGYLASQLDNFYDVVFDGGFGAFATGVIYPSRGQCASIVAFGSTMKNAHIGFISGHYNALANGVYDSQLLDNDYSLGSWTRDPLRLPAGGTFFAYRSVSKGARIQDALYAGSASGSTWYYYDWTSDAPRFFVSKPTSASWPILFDHSQLAPRPGQVDLFYVASSMGPFFLHSTAARSAIRLGQTSMGQSYAIKMQSQIPDWSGTQAPRPDGQADEISW